MMTLVNPHYERLMRLIAEARKQQGLERPVDLLRATKLSKSTIDRLGKGQELGESSLRTIAKAIGWTGDSAEAVLRGGEPTLASEASEPAADEVDLQARYRNRETVLDAGHSVVVVEDAQYRFSMAGPPGTTLAEFDKTRRRVIEALKDAGIEVALRHDETSSGTGEDT